MNTRQQYLKQIRPEIESITIHDNMSHDERFQSLTIRPVVKLQGDLFIAVFRNYIHKHKSVFYDLTLDKRIDYIENAVHKDMKFRNSLKGMVIGMFTVEEYNNYIKNSSALNKRMMHIVKQHLMDNIQLFERYEILEAV
ncbi:glyoxalase [Mangrovimonas aestuarii]|uniref:glyoxalase n=1 Tax=Mangrovimonas aestuarii TaxID=3018443 RepID=UPI00237821B9|nr:glyoxalase [Mangrovimonas aestuarii]